MHPLGDISIGEHLIIVVIKFSNVDYLCRSLQQNSLQNNKWSNITSTNTNFKKEHTCEKETVYCEEC